MSDIIFLSNVRLSFPHLAEPQKQVNEATGATRISYNCEFIMPHDHPGFQQFMKRYGEIALDKWKEHAQAVMNMIQNDRKTRCYGKGEEKEDINFSAGVKTKKCRAILANQLGGSPVAGGGRPTFYYF